MNQQIGVIFDMDGVLVDSYRSHLRSWQETAKRFGVEMSEADFARTFGKTSREIIHMVWEGRFDDAQVHQFDRAKEQRYREVLETDFPEMRGASELIRSLHEAGFRLAIGSSGPPENIAMAIRKLGSGKLIDATVNGSEVRNGKPDPEVFLLAGQKLGIEPSRCAVIEDAPVGVEAARRAGMTAIALLSTAKRENFSRAHLIIESLSHLNGDRIASAIADANKSGDVTAS